MGYQTLTLDEHSALLNKVGNTYMPKEEKAKKKLTLKQLFFIKKKFNK
tara:strand:+ start:791 stop:934 length:144 start_codon:yes stop_codon:yes gene_type:complete